MEFNPISKKLFEFLSETITDAEQQYDDLKKGDWLRPRCLSPVFFIFCRHFKNGSRSSIILARIN